jgi:Na+-transporting NADH:ubiquinone oxidoreductase subunit B
MFSVFAGAAVMGLLFNGMAPSDVPTHAMHTPFYLHWLMGGFAFGTIYMATDPVTAAHSERGKWIYGFFIGVLVVILRVVNPAYPESVMLVILLMNVFAPLIDHIVVSRHIKKRLHRVQQ